MKVIILLGQETVFETQKYLIDKILEAVNDAPNPDDFQIFGNGSQTISQLLDEDYVKKALNKADDDTLVIIRAHGLYILEDGKRVGLVLDNAENNIIDTLNKLPQTVKNIKIHACHSGSLFRTDVKEFSEQKEGNDNKIKATKNRLISAGESSKYPSLTLEDLDHTIKFIQNSSSFSLTPTQAIIADSLSSSLSGYMSYDNPANAEEAEVEKLSRLFRGVKLEDVAPESINKLMDDFIDNRAQELLKLFPNEKDFIANLLIQERENLREDLLKKAPYLYTMRGDLEVMQILAKSGADMDFGDLKPLYFASYQYHHSPEIVEFLLKHVDKNGQKIDPNIPDLFGKTILDRANELNLVETIKILMKDERIYSNAPNNLSKLFSAYQHNHQNVMAFLLQEIDPNVKDETGHPFFMRFLFLNQNNENALKPFLIDEKTNLNIQNNGGNTLLMAICMFGNENIAKLILTSSKPLDLNIKNIKGQTALDIAKEKVNPAIVNLILAKMDQQLIEACKTNNFKLVEELLSSQEINLSSTDKKGNTALYYVSCKNNYNPEIVKLFLAQKLPDGNSRIDINSTDNFLGSTILSRACEFGFYEIINPILQNEDLSKDTIGNVFAHACVSENNKIVEIFSKNENIDLNIKDSQGNTPIGLAAITGNLDGIKILLENSKRNPDLGDEDGKTALMFACENGHRDIVDELLAKAANPNIETLTGETALSFAIANSDKICIKKLLNAGAKLPDETQRKTLLDSIENETVKKEIAEIFETHSKKLEDKILESKIEIKEQKNETIPSSSPAKSQSEILKKNETEIAKG